MPIETIPRYLKAGDDARRNWQTINALRKETERIASDLRNATTAIAELRAKVGWKDPGGGGGIVFYGEWANIAYPKDAMVVIRGGISAGLYISVEPVTIGTASPTNPPADPTQGGPWVMLAPGNSLGIW